MRIDQMRVINFSEAKIQLNQVIDQVVDEGDFTIISRHDAQDAVVMSLDTFNSINETLYLLRSPSNAAHLNRSLVQYRGRSKEYHKSSQTLRNT
jgi:antitoxin YefM